MALAGVAAIFAVAAGIAASWAIHVYDSAPPLSSLKPVQKGRSSAIYASDGSLIGFIRSSNIRQPIASSAMPQSLKEATVAIEDRNFYHHGGIDPAGIARAAWKDLLAGGKPVQGASTITQQLVRNLYIQNPEETIKRKLIEAHLAEEEEEAHSKEWILTAYLNTAPYGTVNGETAVGVQAAAETYFGKPARKLTLPEAAMIAGLPQAPSEYNPFIDPRAALDRRNEVLNAMREQGYITPAEYGEAAHQGLRLRPGHRYQVIRDPLLFDLVEQQLIHEYGVNTVRNGGLKAYTTINPTLQGYAQEAVESCGVCYSGGGPAAALASVDPKTGEIVALASTQERRQPVQLRLAGASPAGLLVQGVRPSDGDQAGDRPLHAPTTTAPRRRRWRTPAAAPGPSTTPSPGRGRCRLPRPPGTRSTSSSPSSTSTSAPQNVTKTAHEMGI